MSPTGKTPCVHAVWTSCLVDRRDHLVVEAGLVTRPADLVAVCGHPVRPASLTTAPLPHCPDCSAQLVDHPPAAATSPRRRLGRLLAGVRRADAN